MFDARFALALRKGQEEVGGCRKGQERATEGQEGAGRGKSTLQPMAGFPENGGGRSGKGKVSLRVC